MPLLLNIDTATEHASVCLSKDGKVLGIQESSDQKNHGTFLQPAIKDLCLSVNIELSSVDAIAVTEGPGSYTGLRVGLASAKGLCYALNKPLILLNTLKVMAASCLQENQSANVIFCPMIDARRMEVFTALYDSSLDEMMPPSAVILTVKSFESELMEHEIVFSGSGHHKLKDILPSKNARFSNIQHNASNMIALAEKAVASSAFADLAYSEPLYLKEFFSPALKR